MAVLPTGIGPVTGYNVERSLRFNSADSAYLNRTPASATNRQTWTWSAWFKRCNPGTRGFLFSAGTNSGTDIDGIEFNTDSLRAFSYNGSFVFDVGTNAVFRDPSAWYHIVVALDTTQATNTNRIKIYVNNVQQTFASATYPSQNANSDNINNTVAHYLGTGVLSNYGNGYLTEIYFVDGQALTPSSFGQTNASTGVWGPIAYTGTYGTNGFYVNFSDNSNTTATTLGKDSSGNGNNWTPNNFSVTAGAGNDSLVDSPTAYGTDTGVGGEVRGNYCTLNPLDNGNSNILLTNGNLSVSSSTTWDRGVKATVGISSGKWYYEYTHGTVNAGTNPAADLGWTKYTSLVNSYANGGGGSSDTYLLQGSNGNKNNGGTSTSYGSSFTTGDTVMCAFDLDNGKMYWGKNGTWFASGDPAAGTNAAYTGLSGTFFPLWYWGLGAGTSGVLISNINFGQRAFAYTAPSGFKALVTTNLPTPTIGATSTTQAGKYFNAVPYTATENVASSITGVGFQPDFVWVKTRADAASHALTDAVRGVEKALFTNTTGAEVTSSTYLTSFNSDGFTQGGAGNFARNSLVAWNWNAGGSNATNTSGTITSTVRANTTSGFSIVTYTGTGSNATVGHGLGVAPSMIILKPRNAVDNWPVWHSSFAVNEYVYLNLTNAKASLSTFMNSTLPSSTVISLGTWANTNTNTQTMVAYCFAPVAGYSAFGSYTGNGSADGVFVYTGFRPRFILFKESSASGNDWYIFDSVRSTYNVATNRLFPNSSAAEATNFNTLDILSNGWKLRDSNSAWNGSGSTYIYACFAENPFKYSLAR
jgi:3D (Asp-Asp-Asp) domain-containing protein